MPAFAAWLVLLPALVLGLDEHAGARTFSVPQAKSAFYAQTGMRLVDFRAASTPDAASLRTSPYRTRRFGTFQLFVRTRGCSSSPFPSSRYNHLSVRE